MRRFIVYQVQILVINTLEIIYFGTQGLKGQYLLSFTVVACQKETKTGVFLVGQGWASERGHCGYISSFIKYKLAFL